MPLIKQKNNKIINVKKYKYHLTESFNYIDLKSILVI